MELYNEYLCERTPKLKLLTDNKDYFLTYAINDDHIYIQDIYIKKEFRGGKLSHEVTNKIFDLARELSKKYVMGSCWVTSEKPERSLVAMFNYGFKIHGIDSDMIWLIKKV